MKQLTSIFILFSLSTLSNGQQGCFLEGACSGDPIDSFTGPADAKNCQALCQGEFHGDTFNY